MPLSASEPASALPPAPPPPLLVVAGSPPLPPPPPPPWPPPPDVTLVEPADAAGEPPSLQAATAPAVAESRPRIATGRTRMRSSLRNVSHANVPGPSWGESGAGVVLADQR